MILEGVAYYRSSREPAGAPSTPPSIGEKKKAPCASRNPGRKAKVMENSDAIRQSARQYLADEKNRYIKHVAAMPLTNYFVPSTSGTLKAEKRVAGKAITRSLSAIFENSPNLQVRQLVLVKEENRATTNWPLGRMMEVIQGNDGLVRVVKVRMQDGEKNRPITKICPLPIDDKPAIQEK